MIGGNGGRSQGVLIPEGQNSERTDAPESSVLSVLPCEFMFVEYVEKGRKVQGVVVRTADGSLYIDPNGSTYTQNLRSVNEKFKRNLEKLLARVPQTPLGTDAEHGTPIQDSTDFLAADMAARNAG